MYMTFQVICSEGLAINKQQQRADNIRGGRQQTQWNLEESIILYI